MQPGDLGRMQAALAAHGPDGGGVWTGGAAGLGQRLMAFTPQDRLERQPRVAADGARVLVCDARLDDRAALARELGEPPLDPDQTPDSEWILRAYAHWGDACAGRLRGVFAFALWDSRRRCVLLARSAIVAPPLLYVATPRRLAFATTAGALQALPGVPRALDEEALADMLAEAFPDPRVTLFRGIRRLPTGHALVAAADGVRESCTWPFDGRRALRFARDEDYIAAFRELFDRVIADHLSSRAPVGVMMSGGLDSAAVAVTAARRLESAGKTLAAFTEIPRAGFAGPVPDGRYADETPYVRAIARHQPNLDLTLVRTDGCSFLDGLDRLFPHLEAPFRNTFNRVWIEAILAAARRRGIAVLLDGMQGNLTASWVGGGLLPGLLRGGRWVRAWREARALTRAGAARSPARALVGQGLLPFLPAPLRQAADRWRGRPVPLRGPQWRVYAAIRPEFAAACRVDERARERARARGASPSDTRRTRHQALADQDVGGYLAAFRGMFGVDLRSPLADPRVAEFCLALPEDQCLYHGQPRAFLRRAMSGRLPPEVLDSRRRGLQAADWFERLAAVRGEVAAELERLERCDVARRALDLPRLRRLLERWPARGWERQSVRLLYQAVLVRGVMTGRFLRWFEGSS